MFTASQLRSFLNPTTRTQYFTDDSILSGHYNATNLLDASYTNVSILRQYGYKPNDLYNVYSDNDILQGGFSVLDLRTPIGSFRGYNLYTIKNITQYTPDKFLLNNACTLEEIVLIFSSIELQNMSSIIGYNFFSK